MHSTLTTRLLALATALLLPVSLAAQQIAQPQIPQPAATATAPSPVPVTTAPAAPSSNDDVVELSPFNVSAEKDTGYTAIDTTSGARIRTDLRDTAASISAFTKQFLEDIGASTLEDALNYASNVENDTEDSGTGFENSAAVNTALGNVNPFRIRGMGMSAAIDLVNTSMPIDFYNIDRVEVTSGPNSILFGTGQAGGMVTLASKRANLQRNTLKIANELGTWSSQATNGSWNYYRASLDYNIVLMPKTFALRLMSTYQDGANDSWRKGQHVRDKRISPTVTFKPWKNTTVSILYEAGARKDPIVYAMNNSDHVTGWLNASYYTDGLYPDRPIQNIYGGPNFPNYTTTRKNSEPYVVLVDNNATVYDARNTLASRGGTLTGLTGNYPFDQGEVRLDPKISSFFASPAGPFATRERRFDRYQLVIDQRLGDLNLQLGFYHNKTTAVAHGPTTWDIGLYGDPNAFLSLPEYLPNGASAIKNPFSGRLYMEDYWGRREGMNRNDVLRLSAEYSLNLKNWGRHRIIANIDHAREQGYKANFQEIIANEKNYAYLHPDTPVGKSTTSSPDYSGSPPANYGNTLWRRHYVTEGDLSTYYDSNWKVPMKPFVVNGLLCHSTYAFDDSDFPYHIKQQDDSITLALQSYWFKDHLVTMLGGRIDRVTLNREDCSDMIDDPNDPRLLSGEMVWHEHYFDGRWRKAPMKTPFTFNAGFVWHLPWSALDRLSLYANASTNRSAPAFGASFIVPSGAPTDQAPWSALPTGTEPPQRTGRTMEAGIMFTIPGSTKTYLRLTYFNTQSLHETVGQNGNIKHTATALVDIYQAFNNTGLMTDAQLASVFSLDTFPYSVGLRDSSFKGFEAELTSQPLKGLTLRLTASYTTGERSNMYTDVVGFYNRNIPVWMRLADPARNGGYNYEMTDANGNFSGYLYDYLIDRLYGGSRNVRDTLNGMARQGSIVAGARPLKFNLVARYSFQQGILKGLGIGAGVRYSDRVRMAAAKVILSNIEPVTADDHPMSLHFDPNIYSGQNGTDRGTSLLFYDTFLTYKAKLFKGRTTMTLQLNIKNIFNNYVVTQGQYRTTDVDQVYYRRVYINPPRSIRLSATFDF